MESKVTLLLTEDSGGFPDCHLIKNGRRGTKPAYKFIVVIPLLAIELKTTLNGYPTNDFYWRRKSNFHNVVHHQQAYYFFRQN